MELNPCGSQFTGEENEVPGNSLKSAGGVCNLVFLDLCHSELWACLQGNGILRIAVCLVGIAVGETGTKAHFFPGVCTSRESHHL